MEKEPGALVGMGGQNTIPLDHASARIVAELSARLLPSLREALTEIRAQEDGERDAAWRKIREAVAGIGERSDKGSEKFSEYWERLSRSLAGLEHRLTAIEERLAHLETLQRDVSLSLLKDAGETPASPNREAPLSDLMEHRIPAWEGLLRAHNQAQSLELNALSTELAELQHETRGALDQTLRETLNQELSRCDTQWGQRLDALQEGFRDKAHTLRRLHWGMLGLGALTLLLLLAILAKI